MATIRDMMAPFQLFQPASVEDALGLLAEHGSQAWVLAGGQDSFDWFKDRIKRPRVVVDLGGVEELKGIRADGEGWRIGAMTPLTSLASDAGVGEFLPLLVEAAEAVATPQIRNQATLGGNVIQDTRCWYYRSGWPCYRAGGNTCYAAAPQAMNREHCILGASRCVAVNPSDTAPALIALGATMVVRDRRREHLHEAEDFFVGPAVDITRMTVLRPGQLLTEIRIPRRWNGAAHYFEKVRDRGSWDFALASVAAVFRTDGERIADARMAVNGVAPYPLRLHAVERLVKGELLTPELEAEAGGAAIRGARALRYNDYKIPLLRNLVRRALRSARGAEG
ncbi:MAG: FAD binding domain-containing protein [Gemmatimonadota bacterium]